VSPPRPWPESRLILTVRYVHPWVAASHLRWFISDFVIKRVLWVLTGTQAGCNQWAGELPPERQGRAYVFLNKSAKAMQFINQPYYSLSPFHRLFAHYIDPPLPKNVDNPRIDVVPFPTRFVDGKAIFPPPPAHRSKEIGWKEECRPDLVIMCTGYRQEWSWLGRGYPKGPDECDVRGVCSSKDPSIAFIGFLRPGVGESTSTSSITETKGMLIGRGDTANGRNASPAIPPPRLWPDPNSHITGELSPPTLSHLSYTIRSRLFDLHGPTRKRYGIRSEPESLDGRVRLVRYFPLLVSLHACIQSELGVDAKLRSCFPYFLSPSRAL
jgi:hypothetical protein